MTVATDYAPSDLDQHGFQTMISVPRAEYGEFGWIHGAVRWVDEGEVHTRDKLHGWRLIWVLFTTHNLKTVDAVFVNSLCQTICVISYGLCIRMIDIT